MRWGPSNICLWFWNTRDEHHTGIAYSSWLCTTEASSFLLISRGLLTFGISLDRAAVVFGGLLSRQFRVLLEVEFEAKFNA